MAIGHAHTKLIDQRDLLELLRQHPLSAPFNLAFFSESTGTAGLWDALRSVCQPGTGPVPCTQDCLQAWKETIGAAMLDRQPMVRCCPQGFIGFAIPLPGRDGLPDFLIGGGTRSGNPAAPPAGTATDDNHAMTLLDPETTGLTVASQAEAQAAASDIFRSLPRMLDQQLHAMSLARTTRRLEAVREVARELARSTTPDQALAVVSEALVVLFDLPKILILLKASEKALTLHSTLGLDKETSLVDEGRLLELLATTRDIPKVLSGDELKACFSAPPANRALLLPLHEGIYQFGAILLFDVDLHSRDLALIELLTSRLSASLKSFRQESGQAQERQYSTRLVSMISALSLVNSREELLRQILDMSAELLSANSGSLMLFDEIEGTLSIAAAKAMNPSLARSMTVPFGEGISGRVAKSGFPMLVNDIERDTRTATRNRPRFKTKSFVSLPLKIEERLIGVLNLADKSRGGSFSEADLKLAQTFTSHAVLMIDRAATLEQAGQFEKLSVTDALTGLYNRRFLETRLQEEINRCQRQGQPFSLVLADLDNFKLYNDICGHLAGDKALRKTAILMRRTAREMDVVTRYGGEEFCLILPGTTKKESVFITERIRRIIETETFPGETHLPLGRLTISLGVATFTEDGLTAAELIHAADLALYRAKAQGRNRLVLYDPVLEKQAPHMKNLPE